MKEQVINIKENSVIFGSYGYRKEIPYQTEIGKEYSESIKDFKEYYNEICNEHFGFLKGAKDTYGECLMERIISELNYHFFQESIYQDYFYSREEYKSQRNYYNDGWGEVSYFEDYEEGWKAVQRDTCRDLPTFSEKKLFVKSYLDICYYTYDMDCFATQLFFNDFKYVSKILKTKSFIEKVKNEELIVYLQNKYDELVKIKYDTRSIKNDKRKPKSYIIKDRSTGHYKIGKSLNPLNREKTLQSEKPDLIMIKEFKGDWENKLHKKYANQRLRGEWFELTKTQLEYICKHYD